ncbi:MAG: glycerophosphodiester phosphodiesterase [Firmicutes bacterium HGW-Firmicutes-2]|jgi:glycerophosphoryl diester phosphodiesterase|nr:MAG: glycerophosphodiester phosphodiesterase [Firmicutes bacterium HGW-Firmicutes-2]
MIIGHKGTSAYAPENTLASIRKAVEMGVKCIEIDVQLTKDKEIVVIHDYTLNRTTNGKGWIKEKTLKEIKVYDAGSWFGKTFEDEKVPTLAEVVKILPKDVWLNIEIKSIARERGDIEARILAIVKAHDILDRVIISSFDHVSLLKFRTLDQDIKIGLLIYAYWINPWEMIELSGIKPYSIHPAIEYLDEAFVVEGKKRGYKVFPYTVNSIDEYHYAMQLGVDGVFSDYPDLAERNQ